MVSKFKSQLILSFSIIIGSIIAAAVGLYFLSQNIMAEVTKIQADRALVNQQTGALDLVAGLKQQAPQAAMYQSAIEQLLPDQDGLITFQDWLSHIASADQVTANASFSLQPPPTNGVSLSTSFFSLEVNGSLNNIVTFLNDIEATSPGFYLHLNSFNLTENGSSYQLTSQGTLYFRP